MRAGGWHLCLFLLAGLIWSGGASAQECWRYPVGSPLYQRCMDSLRVGSPPPPMPPSAFDPRFLPAPPAPLAGGRGVEPMTGNMALPPPVVGSGAPPPMYLPPTAQNAPPLPGQTGPRAPTSTIRPIGPARLMPVRNFIKADEVIPRGVGAYGMVAFPFLPTADTRARLLSVCRAFLSSLPTQSSVPASIPPSELMVTFWPLMRLDLNLADCNILIDNYALFSGLAAIRDAEAQGARFLGRRGPFLIGWSPAESRLRRDSVVLVIDLSPYESESSFLEVFQTWRQQIVERPELWRHGFSIDMVRLSLRDLLDRYGTSILQAVKGPG